MEVSLNLKLKNGIELNLTNDEAKELKDILNGIYGSSFNFIQYPIVIEKWHEYYPHWSTRPIITCNRDQSSYSVSMSLNN